MYKLHKATVQEKIASNNYVKENAWLDLTSSWSIKDLKRSYKTFLEICHGTTYELLVWVIMDTKAEDPRMKALKRVEYHVVRWYSYHKRHEDSLSSNSGLTSTYAN